MKIVTLLTFILVCVTVQAQTLAQQVRALTKVDNIDHVTVARLETIAEALKFEDPRWYKVVGQAEVIPEMALSYLPVYFAGNLLHLDELPNVKQALAESKAYEDARTSSERSSLKAYWSFGAKGENPVLLPAPLLEPVIHFYLEAKDDPNAERIFRAEFRRLTAVMSSMHTNLGDVRVHLLIEKGPEELWSTMTSRPPIVRAGAFLRGERVQIALGALLDPVAWLLEEAQEASLRITSHAMKRFTAINALADLPGDVPGGPIPSDKPVVTNEIPPGMVEACLGPLAGRPN